MPNRNQFLFLSSFLLTFTFLLYISRAFKAKLLQLGLDPSNLILIGLPKDPAHPEMGSYEFQDYYHILADQVKNLKLDDLKAVDVPYVGTVDFIALLSTPSAILTLGIIFATFVWTKVVHSGRRKCLDPKQWKEFPLVKKTQVSPNTAVYRFGLPHGSDILGLPVGQHIQVTAQINGKEVTRSYTPISSDDDWGYFDLLIKTYEKGNISKHISHFKLGDNIRIKGPRGAFQYTPTLASHIGMIAGGTGITPMFQILKACLKNPFDKTTMSLIYANVNEEDILLKEELEELLDLHGAGDRLKIYYVLNNPPKNWKGGVGFVTKEQIQQHLPGPNTNSKILMCGPPPMITAMKKHLEELKYPAPRTVSKLADKVFLF